MSKEKIDPWVCEICGFDFGSELDLATHQFNSSCEEERDKRHRQNDLAAAAGFTTGENQNGFRDK